MLIQLAYILTLSLTFMLLNFVCSFVSLIEVSACMQLCKTYINYLQEMFIIKVGFQCRNVKLTCWFVLKNIAFKIF